jgi:hypothetical protein
MFWVLLHCTAVVGIVEFFHRTATVDDAISIPIVRRWAKWYPLLLCEVCVLSMELPYICFGHYLTIITVSVSLCFHLTVRYPLFC